MFKCKINVWTKQGYLGSLKPVVHNCLTFTLNTFYHYTDGGMFKK